MTFRPAIALGWLLPALVATAPATAHAGWLITVCADEDGGFLLSLGASNSSGDAGDFLVMAENRSGTPNSPPVVTTYTVEARFDHTPSSAAGTSQVLVIGQGKSRRLSRSHDRVGGGHVMNEVIFRQRAEIRWRDGKQGPRIVELLCRYRDWVKG